MTKNITKVPLKEHWDFPEFWKTQIDILLKYCEKKKWTVEFIHPSSIENDDIAIPEKKKLYIRKDRRPEITFYYFLHEIGHIIVWNSKNYSNHYAHSINCSKNSQVYRVNVVEEEYDAWKAGKKLANRLDLKINRTKLEEIKARCLTTYFMWTLRRKFNKAISERNK